MIQVQTDKSDEVIRILETHLCKGSETEKSLCRTVGWLEEIYGEDFILSMDKPPTKFAVGAGESGWEVIHCNSFFDCHDLLEKLSRELHCLVVHVMAQSVSDAYLITIWRDGENIRILEFADGVWVKNEGTPLPFEKDPLGQNIGKSDDPFFVFEEEDLSEYCENLGFDPWADENVEGWTILSASPQQSDVT